MHRPARMLRTALAVVLLLGAVALAAFGWLAVAVIGLCAVVLALAWLRPSAVGLLADPRLRSRLPYRLGRTPFRVAVLGSFILIPAALVTDALIAPPPLRARCDPSYPDVCIAPPPPQLSCDDIGEHDFRADAPDPHNLDADADRVACESSAPFE